MNPRAHGGVRWKGHRENCATKRPARSGAAVFGDEFVTKKPRPTITPTNRAMKSRYIATSQPHQMAAFVGIAALLRAWLAAHALFRPPGDGRLHRVVRSASNAFHFQIAIAGVERATAQWRWLRRPAIAFQAQIPRLAGGLITAATLLGLRYQYPR